MTLYQFLRILRARWALALSIFSVLVLCTLAVSLLLPKNYTASVNVMADIRPDPISPLAALSNGLASTYLETQVDIIKSAAVSERVVRILNLTDNAEMRSRWATATKQQGDFTAWLGDLIARGLEVKPSRESSIIQIKYESNTPAFAAALANAYAKAYIETSVRIKADPARQYAEFFEERAQLAREKLEKARSKLVAAQKSKDIIITDERLDVELLRLSELATQVTGLRNLRAETLSRSSESGKTPDQMRDVLNNPVVANMKAELARLEVRLSELSERYGEAYPTVIQTQVSIDTLRDRIRVETSKVSKSANIDNTMASSRASSAEQQFDEQRQRVLKMKDARAELQVLEKEVETAQRIYDSIQERLNQSSLESKTSQSTLYILSPATEPTQPTSPRIILNVAVSVVLGALLAVVGAMTAELLDRRVRTPLDIVQVLELPVIGFLPGPSAKQAKLRKILGPNKRLYSPVASLPTQQ